jgi:hypothetical protein
VDAGRSSLAERACGTRLGGAHQKVKTGRQAGASRSCIS